MRLRGKRVSELGFTLVEVITSTVLCAFMITALVGSMLSTHHMGAMARVETEALSVLQSYVESEKARPYVSIGSSVNNDVMLSNNLSSAAEDNILGTVVITVTDNGDDTKTIVGTVSWTQRFLNANLSRSVVLTTLVSEP